MLLPRSISDWPKAWLELFQERAGIMEHEGKMSKWKAEKSAEEDIRKLASLGR